MSAKCTVADPYNQSNSMMILVVIMLIIIMLNDYDINYLFIPACSRFGFGTSAPLAENRHNMAEQKTDDRGDHVHHAGD